MCTTKPLAEAIFTHGSTRAASINGLSYVIMRQSNSYVITMQIEHTNLIEDCGIKNDMISF